MKVCSNCGYGHKVVAEPGPDVCQNCGKPLLLRPAVLMNLRACRMSRPNERTGSRQDEEERQRIGYELQSTFRFGEFDGRQDVRTAEVNSGDVKLASLRYGDAAWQCMAW